MKNKTDALTPMPLSQDLELRPRGWNPLNVHQLLGSEVDRFAEDLVEASASLRRLARGAHAANDVRTEAALRAKLAELAMALLKLCRDDVAEQPSAIRSQRDLPDIRKLSPQTRQRLNEVWANALHEWEEQHHGN